MIKENYVRDYLRDEFKEDITMVFNKSVKDGCSARRPDVLIDFGSHVVIIECDENQHKNYSRECDNKRTMLLFKDCGDRPIVFIRLNPDRYRVGKIKYDSCFNNTKAGSLSVVKKDFIKRMVAVVTLIERYKCELPVKEVTIERLFYDEEDEQS